MFTNLDWLYENNRETLIHMVVGDCSSCKFINDCDNGYCRCDYDWIDAEYIEPDSWEKIEADARKGMDYYYTNVLNMKNKNSLTAADMHRYVVEGIINRCKALAGAE